MISGTQRHSPTIPPLLVRTMDKRIFRFSRPFCIGRDAECDVQIDNIHVSRKHVEVSFSGEYWRFRDLHSSNGIFINGERVETASIEDALTLHLGGIDGPSLLIELDSPIIATNRHQLANRQTVGGETVLLESYAERYFGSKDTEKPVGRRTMMIRKAFQNIQKKQQRKYGWVVGGLAVLGVLLGSYAFYGHRQLRQQQALAQDLFYAMKALDVDIANVERLMAESKNPQNHDQVTRYLERRREMERNYDTFLSGLQLYGRSLTEEERVILRVTRTFGECELVAPREYLTEVMTYIRKWQSTGRYARAMSLAQERGYTRKIAEEFIAQNLPPQFFYLAMQESDFDPFRSGPPTRMGIAKGMWQFIPETATRYGLSVGPLVRFQRPDPADDRSHWEKATKAAARYIKEIYSTDAQASGLLVMASYNWGEGRIINLLRSMPANPKERNFWKLLEKYRDRVPKETYDYVFYIVSATVIGENPRLFGFTFDNPLVSASKP
jgi:membrane-bound lytic murein transglycosylase D